MQILAILSRVIKFIAFLFMFVWMLYTLHEMDLEKVIKFIGSAYLAKTIIDLSFGKEEV